MNHRRLKCRILITHVPNAGTLSVMLVNFVLQVVFWAKYSTYNQNALQLLHVQTVITLKYIRHHRACSEIFSIYLLINGCWGHQFNDGLQRMANKIALIAKIFVEMRENTVRILSLRYFGAFKLWKTRYIQSMQKWWSTAAAVIHLRPAARQKRYMQKSAPCAIHFTRVSRNMWIRPGE